MCGKTRTGDWITCESCLERNRASSKKISRESKNQTINRYRDRCREEGICYGCGTYIGLGKYKTCPECRRKGRLANTRRLVKWKT